MDCVFCSNHELDLRHLRKRIAQLQLELDRGATPSAKDNAWFEIQALQRTLATAEKDYEKHRAVHAAPRTGSAEAEPVAAS